jgi:glycosyltransferase involved in cell wall biosynthesis
VEIEKRRLVFTAGRLWDEGKNIALLDRIAPALDAPLLAAGPLVAPHGAAAHYPHLRCLGSLSERDIAPWYAAAAIFAAPARYEPFGLAVLQAAQAGAALVLSDIPTFRELWGDAALLLSPDDPGAWRKALARLLELPERVRALGAAAQARAARYSVDTMVAGTLAIYRGALMSGDAVSLPLRSAS